MLPGGQGRIHGKEVTETLLWKKTVVVVGEKAAARSVLCEDRINPGETD